jgi:predicted enzyme related to lactoylglutathione lyase
MATITGIGGIFFEANDPEALYAWYDKHLGVKRDDATGAVMFISSGAPTVWSVFERDTPYFRPGNGRFMVNYTVDDLDALLRQLEHDGIACEGRDSQDYGDFAWIRDPEGNRIELWQPSQ